MGKDFNDDDDKLSRKVVHILKLLGINLKWFSPRVQYLLESRADLHTRVWGASNLLYLKKAH